MPRRQLGYQVSLLLDTIAQESWLSWTRQVGEPHLILSGDDIVEIMRVFLPDTANQARLIDRVDAQHRPNRGDGASAADARDRQPVRSPANPEGVRGRQWLSDLDQRLAAYREHAVGDDAIELTANE